MHQTRQQKTQKKIGCHLTDQHPYLIEYIQKDGHNFAFFYFAAKLPHSSCNSVAKLLVHQEFLESLEILADFDTLLCPSHRIIDNDLELSNQPSCGIALRELTAYFGALTGPYGIRMDVAPGCEKGAEYVLGRLRDDWLPRSLRYYGDPFVGKVPSRVYTIKVRRNDGGGKSKYTGPSGFFGFGCGNIGLAKDSDKYEFALDWLAASVLTVCEEPNSSSFQQYVKRFLEGEAKGQDPVPQIKKDIQDGLAMEGADRRKKYPYMHTSMWAVFEELREKHPKFMQEYYQLKNSRFAEGRLPEKLSFDQVAGLLSEVTHENVTELCKKQIK